MASSCSTGILLLCIVTFLLQQQVFDAFCSYYRCRASVFKKLSWIRLLILHQCFTKFLVKPVWTHGRYWELTGITVRTLFDLQNFYYW